MPKHPLEVKSTPESEKYIKRSFLWRKLGRPLLSRGAWLASAVLSTGAVIPLGIKGVVNVVDGFFNHSSWIEAAKNAAGILGFPLVGIVSGLSVIAPNQIGNALVKTLLMPIRFLYKNSTSTPGKWSIKNEVGPCETSDKDTAVFQTQICCLKLEEREVPLVKGRSYPRVTGPNNLLIDSADIPHENKETVFRYRIVFQAAGEIYQISFKEFAEDAVELNCHTRVFNYPSITRGDDFETLDDLVNAGIAEVYDVAKRKNWSNKQIEKNVHLYAYCFAGSIVLEVAAYFKEKHNIDLTVFIDRSYSSTMLAAAHLIMVGTGLPLWYSKIFATVCLFAGGELNRDCVAIIKSLNREKIQYVNLGHRNAPIKPSNFFQKCKHFLGIGTQPPSADFFIRDGAALADGLAEAKLVCGNATTRYIFNVLNIVNDHRIYPYSDTVSVNDHMLQLRYLCYVNNKEKISALNFYMKSVMSCEEAVVAASCADSVPIPIHDTAEISSSQSCYGRQF